MDSDTAPEERAESLAEEDDESVLITDWKVRSDGRLTIPKDTRERHDIEEGDYVDAVLVVPEK